MAINRLKATICGTTYTITSEESLSYMRDLVAQVDGEMTELVKNNARLSTTMAAVLTALQNADKARKESQAAEALRLKLKLLVDDAEHLKDQLSAAREENARLSEELLRLRTGTAPQKSVSKKVNTPSAILSFEEILDEADPT